MSLGALIAAAGLDPAAGVGELAASAQSGDERALEALTAAGHWLGVGIASAANLLNPRGIIVGGYLATLAPWLTPGIEREFEERVLRRSGTGRRS